MSRCFFLAACINPSLCTSLNAERKTIRGKITRKRGETVGHSACMAPKPPQEKQATQGNFQAFCATKSTVVVYDCNIRTKHHITTTLTYSSSLLILVVCWVSHNYLRVAVFQSNIIRSNTRDHAVMSAIICCCRYCCAHHPRRDSITRRAHGHSTDSQARPPHSP